MMPAMRRRTFLTGTVVVTTPLVAGCIGGGGDDGGTTAADGKTTAAGTTAATGTTANGETPVGGGTGTDEVVTDATTGSGATNGVDGGAGTTADPADGTAAASTTVTMKNTAFDPVRASVDPGTTVEWPNEDGFAHTVTSSQFHDAAASWEFDERVPAGESVSHTFESSGVFEYYCTVHGESQMCGVVLVGDASLDASLPCEGGGTTDDSGTTAGDGGGGDGDDGGYY
ncbi:hypothetical protein BRC90_00610 [Halobacteriales archaeon QS_4_69_34]|nr:MAG: hypothetical protein BRC90_00610 [Halobacteriales archaeon QS_4_69_34]